MGRAEAEESFITEAEELFVWVAEADGKLFAGALRLGRVTRVVRLGGRGLLPRSLNRKKKLGALKNLGALGMGLARLSPRPALIIYIL